MRDKSRARKVKSETTTPNRRGLITILISRSPAQNTFKVQRTDQEAESQVAHTGRLLCGYRSSTIKQINGSAAEGVPCIGQLAGHTQRLPLLDQSLPRFGIQLCSIPRYLYFTSMVP
jgi:hypothetical protein